MPDPLEGSPVRNWRLAISAAGRAPMKASPVVPAGLVTHALLASKLFGEPNCVT